MSKSAVTLGDLISIFYEEYLALYGDEELAATATAETINEILATRVDEESQQDMQDC